LKNTLQMKVQKQGSPKVPQIIFLPHEVLCPEGMVIEADSGTTICDAALKHHVEIEHACEKSCACTTCHIYIREGMDSLNENTEDEDDMLDKAWGLDPDSRLSCQTVIGDNDLVIEIPKYTINMVSENH
jgi:2Fe-2S ferredoxin